MTFISILRFDHIIKKKLNPLRKLLCIKTHITINCNSITMILPLQTNNNALSFGVRLSFYYDTIACMGVIFIISFFYT
jgi:hypothetical protein